MLGQSSRSATATLHGGALYEKEEHCMKKNYMGIGIGVGLCLGVALGAAMRNVGLGIALGLVFGVAVGAGLRRKQNKE